MIIKESASYVLYDQDNGLRSRPIKIIKKNHVNAAEINFIDSLRQKPYLRYKKKVKSKYVNVLEIASTRIHKKALKKLLQEAL